jgi:SAM-dependent methyltransferase
MNNGNLSETVIRYAERYYACHCCGSGDTAYLQHYVLRRSLSSAPLYECRTCGSVSVDFATVKKNYPASNSQDAIEFHRKILTRNQSWSNLFLDALQARRLVRPIASVIDVGCGSGILLGVAANRGLRAVGYEIDELAVEEARLKPHVEIVHDLFNHASPGIPDAIVCCIMVLEHLERPLDLLAEIGAYCHLHGSAAFVSVPLLPTDWRRFLEESALEKGNPFFDNEEHVTHFTRSAFETAWCAEFEGTPQTISAGGWFGWYYGGLE